MKIIENIWEEKVSQNFKEIKELRSKEWAVNLPAFSGSVIIPNSAGLWEKKYYQTKAEIDWLRKSPNRPLDEIPEEEAEKNIPPGEVEEIKKKAHEWLSGITENIVKEVGKFKDYDSFVDRIKGNNYHQRGHYFIFYEDGSKDHWLALYPPFNDSELVSGHKHGTFNLEFSKSVQKFVDVYTCIGCGAVGQGYTVLHSHYDIDANNPSDSWDTIYKGLPFEPWFTEFTTTNFQRQSDGRIMSASGKYCLGNNGHLNDYHVWQGTAIEDKTQKTFDKAYGYIPKTGVIQWKLERNPQNERTWVEKRTFYFIDALWEKPGFANYDNKSPYEQKMMELAIKESLKEKNYNISYQDIGNINDWLARLASDFKEFINIQKTVRQSLEKWIERILNSSDYKLSIKEEIVKIKDQLVVPSRNRPLILSQVWGLQVEKMIKEGKAKEIYQGKYRIDLTWEEAEKGVNWLYQEVFDAFGINKKVSEIQQQFQAYQEQLTNDY